VGQFDKFEIQHFNSLTGPLEAEETLKRYPGAISTIGSIIRKYGLENDVAVALLHKHFKLNKEEVLLAKKNGDEIVMQPTIPKTATIVPRIWKLLESPSAPWTPIEYVENDDSKELESQIDRIAQKPQFLQEVSKAIHHYHLADVLGIALILGGMFPVNSGFVFHETTRTEERTSVLALMDKQVRGTINVVETMWDFSGSPMANCSHSCNCCKGKKC
jgi:hypothetical protein